MSDLRAAAQQFVADYENGDLGDLKHYARALRAALEQPEQEPVAWLYKWAHQDDGLADTDWAEGYEAARRVVRIHLEAPPQRKPMPDEEIPIKE